MTLEARAVTAGDVWLFDPATRVLAAGDLVTLPAPFLDTACPERWKAALDRVAHQVVLADGARVDYDRLVLATGGRVRASPSVCEGTVYCGSFDGFVYALDEKSGEERWKFATRGVSIDCQKEGYDRRSVQSSTAVTPRLDRYSIASSDASPA